MFKKQLFHMVQVSNSTAVLELIYSLTVEAKTDNGLH